jgi:uncharacterized protein YndB with AHSA1/START domain
LIAAERAISAPPEQVWDFLSDLRNHWRLERRFLELEDMEPDGGVIRLTGPLRLSRRARTAVLEADRPHRVAGRADLRGGTVGLVSWEIRSDGPGSVVRLAAEIPHAWWPDRLFLVLGGARWFRRLFERALDSLEETLSRSGG